MENQAHESPTKRFGSIWHWIIAVCLLGLVFIFGMKIGGMKAIYHEGARGGICGKSCDQGKNHDYKDKIHMNTENTDLQAGVVHEGGLDLGRDDDDHDEMNFADVPAIAQGPAMNASGYYLEEISPDIYWITEGAYHAMFVVTSEGVIVVDAPPSVVSYIPGAIASVTDLPITHVIYTHVHADHIAGAGTYPLDATYIAHSLTKEKLEQERAYQYGAYAGGGDVPLPTITFDDTYTLEVGGKTLQLDYKSEGHTPGNIFVYAPAEKILMYIDVIFPGWSPFKSLAVAENVPAYIQAHDHVLAYDFKKLVSGHVGRLGTREDVETQKQYILDIQANAEKALQTVNFQDIATEIGYSNPWALLETYLASVDAECARLTEDTWIGKLGGVDVFTESHCEKMVESIRID